MIQTKYFKNLVPLVAGIAITISALEVLFRILPVKTVHKFANNDVSEPVLRSNSTSLVEPIDWKFSQKYERKINNYGFVDDFDYIPKSQPIAVIGDSYIQSSMLPYSKTIQGRLAAKSGNKVPVYSFGIPMYSLAGYLGAAEYASKEFQPRAFIFLLNESDIHRSLEAYPGSYFLTDADLELKFKDDKGSRLNRILSESALFRYLFVQIKFDPQKIIKAQFQSPKSTPILTQDRCQQISNRLLDLFAAKTTVTPQNTIFIIDSDRQSIYDRKPPTNRHELLTFKNIATARGYRVIDTQPTFQAEYQRTGKKLDFLPTDFHWNARAHQLAADLVDPILTDIVK